MRSIVLLSVIAAFCEVPVTTLDIAATLLDAGDCPPPAGGWPPQN